MIVFQIEINGTAYGETLDIAAITLVAERGRRLDRVSMIGQSTDEQVHLFDAHLAIGDEIVIRIVESMQNVPSLSGCNFCGRPTTEVKRLVAGVKAAICGDCTMGFAAAIHTGGPLPLGAALNDQVDAACEFCLQPSRELGGVIVRNGARICAQCVHACEDLAQEP